MHPAGRHFACLAVLTILAPAARADEPVSFRNEVMAVLSRGGCNAGACHGNQNGKNGFKLSLRGEDPAFDLAVLTRDTLARRTDRFHPEESLILLKATATIPHEGAKRFAVGSREYDILRRWVAAGCLPDPPGAPLLQRLDAAPRERVLTEPADEVPLHVTATFSDGRSRDVTDLCVFEPSNLVVRVGRDGVARRQGLGETTILVRYLDHQAVVQLAFIPNRPDFAWTDPPENNFIDRPVYAKLRTLRMLPSGLCSDAVFLRRAYLDAIGMPPTPEESRRFLDDARPDKRARLIDELLGRPEFADFWALKWCDLLRVEEKALDRKGVRLFHDWIRQSIADGKPLNEFAAKSSPAAAAPTPTPRPISTAPSATRSAGRRPRPRCFSASACSAPSATTTRSSTGRRPTTTAWPPSSSASTTASSKTTAATSSTSTSSTATRSCTNRAPARAFIRVPRRP